MPRVHPVTGGGSLPAGADEEHDPEGEAILAALAAARGSEGRGDALGRALAGLDTAGVERVGAPGPLDAAFVRRIKALLHTRPIHELEANKRRAEDGREAYDLQGLALHALEMVAEGGEAGGADEQEVVDSCTRVALFQAPAAGTESAALVAQTVVDHLLNRGDGLAARQYPYTAEDPATGELAVYTCWVRLLGLTEDGELEVSTEGINLLLRAFDTNAADDHAAGEYLAEEQLRRGRFADLARTTRDNVLRTRRFTRQLRRVMELAQEDITGAGDPGDIVAALDEASAHIDARRDAESRILDRVRYILNRVDDPGVVRHLVDVERYVGDCRHELGRLHTEIMRVLPVLRHEQTRQRFRPPMASLRALVLRRDLLLPLLALPVARSAVVLTGFVDWLVGPRPPQLCTLSALVEQLLAPPRERVRERVVDEPAEVSDSGPLYSRFTVVQVNAARALLAQAVSGCRLSDLLLAADQEGDPAVTTLVALGALAAFSDRADHRTALSEADSRLLVPPELHAEDDGTLLVHPVFAGSDLLLGGAVQAREPDIDPALHPAERPLVAGSNPARGRSRRRHIEAV